MTLWYLSFVDLINVLTNDAMSKFYVSMRFHDTDLWIVEQMKRVLDFVSVVESFDHDRDIRILSYQVFSIDPRLIIFVNRRQLRILQSLIHPYVVIQAIILNSTPALNLCRLNYSDIVFENSLHIDLEYLFDIFTAQMTPLLLFLL